MRTIQLSVAGLLLASAGVVGVAVYPSATAERPSTGEASGVLPGNVSVFDDRYPGVTNLDPYLLRALRDAAHDAGTAGVQVYLTSGWRSPEYQEQLLKEAVVQYGSEAAATRWVATPQTSPHVSGKAIDVGGSPAIAWLVKWGAAYGLCQVYRNEPWHFELRPSARRQGCPDMYADPTHDPRMQR